MPSSPKVKVRETPRLSVNKLGEYMEAKPLRRQRILQQAKFPPTFLVNRYEEACDAIVDYFTGGRHMSPVLRKLEEVYARRDRTPFEQQNDRLTSEVLELFYENGDDLTLPDEFTALSGLHSNLPLAELSGTEVSIRPEVLLHHQLRGTSAVGAIKLYLSKTHPLTSDAAAYVGALVRYQMQNVYTKTPKVNPKFCLVYDVFANTLHLAPRAYIARFNEVTAACTEIAARWDSITNA
jgi:hypothetical protein